MQFRRRDWGTFATLAALFVACSGGQDATGAVLNNAGGQNAGGPLDAGEDRPENSGTDPSDGDDAGVFDATLVSTDGATDDDAASNDAALSYVEDAALTVDNACGTGSAEAMLKPVNMFVMFDRSRSMDKNNKWTDASAALTAFFRDPGAAGLGVALRFFPHDSPASGCTKDICDAVACSTPLVPLSQLTADAAPTDSQEELLVQAVMSSAPGGGGSGTPTYAALDGALRWATTYQAAHGDETTVVIFVTDGSPNGCDENLDNIAALASDALASSDVRTYAIGLEGSNTAEMDQLAQAGGTTQGIYVSSGSGAEQNLLDALNSIRGQTLSCDFPIPEAKDDNMKIDPARVNVTVTPNAKAASTLAQVTDAAACGTSKAWHYDNATDPTRIVLCPSACDFVRGSIGIKIEILLGCQTVCGGLDVSCGTGEGPPPPVLPPVLL